jgi:hypothetical protein
VPVSNVGIVYSKSQEVVRRVINLHIGIVDGEPNRLLPEHEIEVINEEQAFLRHQQAMHPNEGWATIPRAVYETFSHARHIHDHLGLKGIPAVTDRCAVVNRYGLVVAVGCYDPFIDLHPAGEIVPHATVEVGGTLINGLYNPPAFLLVYASRHLIRA